jgi:hypothetical protein
VSRKFFSLFPGLGYAAGYKVLQRVYKYGGQPIARDWLTAGYGMDFENAFGKKTGKAILHSTAGRFGYPLATRPGTPRHVRRRNRGN